MKNDSWTEYFSEKGGVFPISFQILVEYIQESEFFSDRFDF